MAKLLGPECLERKLVQDGVCPSMCCIESRPAFNYGEFAGIKSRVVNAFPGKMGTGTADRDSGGNQIGTKRSFAMSKGRSQVKLGNEEKGWKVIRIWEHDLQKKNHPTLLRKITCLFY